MLSTCHQELPKRSPEPGRSAARRPSPAAAVIAEVLFLSCTNVAAAPPRHRRRAAAAAALTVRPAKASWTCLVAGGGPLLAPPGWGAAAGRCLPVAMNTLHVSTQGNVFTFMDLSANLYILGGKYNKRKIKKCQDYLYKTIHN